MFVKLYERNPNREVLEQIVAVLKSGGVVIYPTDTIYAMGCDLMQPKAIEKMAQLKGDKDSISSFSIICSSISEVSEYTKLDNEAFKLLKRNLPGAFTFILPTSHAMQKKLNTKRKEIGIRIPDNPITMAITEALGNPIVTTSIKDEDEVIEYTTDPELIFEKYQGKVAIVIDGGYGNNIASTVIDCTTIPFEIVREGAGKLS